MKIVIAFDSFKGSLSSLEAGHAAAEGIKRFSPQIETKVIPMADGGQGSQVYQAPTSGKAGIF